MTAKQFMRKFPTVREINENTLVDFACPECGSRGRFEITATSTFTMDDHGADGYSDIEWDDDSSCSCRACGHGGTVKDFEVKGLDEALEEKQ